MCATKIGEPHSHVADLFDRKLCCVCRPCALLFVQRREGRFRTVPERVVVDPAFQLDGPTWDGLQVPVRLAFFFFNSSQQRWQVAYPSPAGITESDLPDAGWKPLLSAPLLSDLEPDVEALLVYGPPGASDLQSLLVPITACYELAGELRTHWRGMAGVEAQKVVRRFIAELTARSRSLRASAGGRV
jgi:hypothetical protein